MEDVRGPGRPRSERSRQAILAAALELAADPGYGRLTIEGIAARAGVGKQTIYRWWNSKADVLLEAIANEVDLSEPIADRGSYADDLRAFLEESYGMAGRRDIADVLRGLMAEAQVDSGFGERFHAAFLDRRADALAVIMERARQRDDLPAYPDAADIGEIIFGTLWYRVLAGQRPVDPGLMETLVSMLSDSHSALPQPLPRVAPRRAPLPWRTSSR